MSFFAPQTVLTLSPQKKKNTYYAWWFAAILLADYSLSPIKQKLVINIFS